MAPTVGADPPCRDVIWFIHAAIMHKRGGGKPTPRIGLAITCMLMTATFLTMMNWLAGTGT
jgi:hypothetical protein